MDTRRLAELQGVDEFLCEYLQGARQDLRRSAVLRSLRSVESCPPAEAAPFSAGGAGCHVLIHELADDDVARICRFYASLDDRALHEFDSTDDLKRWAGARGRSPSSVALWGIANRWTFKEIEVCEEGLLRPDWVR